MEQQIKNNIITLKITVCALRVMKELAPTTAKLMENSISNIILSLDKFQQDDNNSSEQLLSSIMNNLQFQDRSNQHLTCIEDVLSTTIETLNHLINEMEILIKNHNVEINEKELGFIDKLNSHLKLTDTKNLFDAQLNNHILSKNITNIDNKNNSNDIEIF